MEAYELKGKDIAMIIWNSEDDQDVRVFIGNIVAEGKQYFFVNEQRGWRVPLDEEQLERLMPVTEDFKETLLGADYHFSMTMGNLPENPGEDMESTGMNWNG